jgi:hypothetical protein
MDSVRYIGYLEASSPTQTSVCAVIQALSLKFGYPAIRSGTLLTVQTGDIIDTCHVSAKLPEMFRGPVAVRIVYSME